MSLKIIKLDPRIARAVLIVIALLCITAGWFFIRWYVANTIAWRIDPRLPESRLVADWLSDVSPQDPVTHFAAASIFEKTFDPDDLQLALQEHEAAAAAAPHNYLMWLNLARSRGLNGEIDGADAAYRRALELAPNYAVVHWAYGNFLVRQGRTDEGFSLLARAAAANPDYSRAAVTMALQIFDGDTIAVLQALGNSSVSNAALAASLAGQGKFEDAIAAWSRLDEAEKDGDLKKLGETLRTQLIQAKQFRLAARVAGDLWQGAKPAVGQIGNGSFESPVKLRDAQLFDWQISDGSFPQVGLTDGQKRTGKYSFWMMFNSSEAAGFRTLSQTIAVNPGGSYEFTGFYRSEIKSAAKLRWEVAAASTLAPLAATEPLGLAGDWTTLKTVFKVPADTDGIVIRLVREGCSPTSCPMTGRLSFDDLSLRQL
ncbi:MAG: tetratricopeptide repeat protein [Pyrinomonadaceae bacterium]